MTSKLIAAQAAIKPVEKDGKNDFQKYRYASSEAVIEEARKALNGAGLALITTGWRYMSAAPEECEYARLLSEGGKMFTAHAGRVFVGYALIGDDMPMVFECETPVIPERGRPLDKSMAAALTYNLAYFLRGLLLIPRGDDDAEVDKRADRGAQPRQQQPTQQRPPATPQAKAQSVPAVTSERMVATFDELKARTPVAKCAILTGQWAAALGDLIAYYGNANHAVNAAAQLGHAEITDSNVVIVAAELRVWAEGRAAEKDAENAAKQAAQP